MRCLARIGHDGTRCGPVGRIHGVARSNQLRDDDASRYQEKGGKKAVEHINTEISEAIMGLDASEQVFLDKALICSMALATNLALLQMRCWQSPWR